MAQKKSRQTFEKLKREQAIREKRVRKQERKAAARLAKAGGGIDDSAENGGSDGARRFDRNRRGRRSES